MCLVYSFFLIITFDEQKILLFGEFYFTIIISNQSLLLYFKKCCLSQVMKLFPRFSFKSIKLLAFIFKSLFDPWQVHSHVQCELESNSFLLFFFFVRIIQLLQRHQLTSLGLYFIFCLSLLWICYSVSFFAFFQVKYIL